MWTSTGMPQIKRFAWMPSRRRRAAGSRYSALDVMAYRSSPRISMSKTQASAGKRNSSCLARDSPHARPARKRTVPRAHPQTGGRPESAFTARNDSLRDRSSSTACKAWSTVATSVSPSGGTVASLKGAGLVVGSITALFLSDEASAKLFSSCPIEMPQADRFVVGYMRQPRRLQNRTHASRNPNLVQHAVTAQPLRWIAGKIERTRTRPPAAHGDLLVGDLPAVDKQAHAVRFVDTCQVVPGIVDDRHAGVNHLRREPRQKRDDTCPNRPSYRFPNASRTL